MTMLLIANHGGHISELWGLANRLDGDERVWITNDHTQTRHILAGEDVVYVPFIDARDLAGVVRAIPHALRYLRSNRIDLVVSSGAAIALAWLPLAALLGIPTHYIESSARIQAPSLTGKILQRIPRITTWWQYDNPPAGWQALSGLFARYSSIAVDEPAPIKRIFATVGTTEYGFERLINRLADIVPAHVDVVWQTGDTDVSGLDIDGQKLMPAEELLAEIRKADVVVTHAGAGSLFNCLELGKVPVYVPRRGALGEHVDDHQTELADWAHAAGLAISADAAALTWNDLEQASARQATALPAEPLDLTSHTTTAK